MAVCMYCEDPRLLDWAREVLDISTNVEVR